MRLISNNESKESDTARRHDLAPQYGLAIKLVGDTYLVV